MSIMGKFNCIQKCVAILPVLGSGYQPLVIFEMFNVGASREYEGASRGEYIPGSALIKLSFLEKSFSGFPQISKLFPLQGFFGYFFSSIFNRQAISWQNNYYRK